MKNNIEHLFNTLYDNEVDAPKNAWNAIENDLLEDNIETIVGSSVADASHLWGNLATKLRWLNFWHFSPLQFNVYYLGLLLGIATVVGVGNVNTSTSDTENTSLITQNKNRALGKNPVSQYKKQLKSIESEKQSQASKEEVSQIINFKKRQPKQRKTNKIQNSTVYGKKQITYSAMIYPNETKQVDTKTKPQGKGELAVIDTMIVYDTVKVFDTVSVAQKISTPVIPTNLSETPRWIASLFVAPAVFDFETMSDFGGSERNWATKIREVEKPKDVLSFGIGLKRNVTKHIFIGTGAQYTNYHTSFQCEEIRTTIDTSTQVAVKTYQTQHILDKYETTMDTIERTPFVFNVYENGHLVKTDTSWYYVVDTIVRQTQDTITVWEKDTIVSQSVDTTKEIRQYIEQNVYTYMQIPLMLGYRFSKGKFDVSLSGGLMTNIFLNAKGKGVSMTETGYKVDDVKNLPFAKFNFSIMANTGISFHMDKHVALMSQLFLMQNINNIYDSKFVINRKNTTFGVKIGINYLFY